MEVAGTAAVEIAGKAAGTAFEVSVGPVDTEVEGFAGLVGTEVEV